jgi:formylglycine-generating enzyme required for sulfatase activity
MKQCPHCDAELRDEARFCWQCGLSQTGAAPGPQAAVRGDGAAAQQGGMAVGAHGVAVGGNVGGDVIVGPRAEYLSPEDLREAYLYHLVSTVGQVPLSGIDPKAASDSEARLELRSVYTGLRTLTPEESVRLEEPAKLDDRASPEKIRSERRRLSALAQLDRHDRLVLLGDPGSGKSTFVNFVALCMAGERLGLEEANLERLTAPLPQDEERDRDEAPAPQPQPWSHGALLPVHVVLRDFAARGLPPAGDRATAQNLGKFIANEINESALGEYGESLVWELFKTGGLLLLDGLDEVPRAEHRREQIKQAIQDFAGTFVRCRILVTSRTYAYQQQAWRLRDFEEAVLAPFGPGQIRRFVDRWYAHISELRGLHLEEAQGRAALLKRAIETSGRLYALSERPLLLTLMASLHAWRGGSLPERREELYADTVDLLLDWWERPKAVRDGDGHYVVRQPSLTEWLRVDRERVRGLLERLAYEAHAAQPDMTGTADVPEGDLLGGLLRLRGNPDVRQQRLVEYLSQRAGLLVPRGVGIYTFPHRTFQEYLAACYLTDHDYPEVIAELARRDPNRWREVALLAGAKSARGSDFALWALVGALCYRELPAGSAQREEDAWGALLAGRALVESADLAQVSPRNQGTVAKVRAHLVRVMAAGKLPAVERVEAGRTLAALGDPRSGVGLREDGLPDLVWCEVPAGPFLMGSSDADEMAFSREKPQHTYEIEQPYAISRYPVTNAQYAAFVRAGGYREARYWTEAGWAWREGEAVTHPEDYGPPYNLPNHPVVGVSWYEAAAFCRWLEERLRVARCEFKVWENGELREKTVQLETFNVQLPSEPQWEKAARGGDGRRYPWGDDPDLERANYGDTGIGTTSAVGGFPGGVSLYGLENLSGNVAEWCRTKWEGDYRGYRGDADVEGNDRRVLRGGAFSHNPVVVRCAYRRWNLPYVRGANDGFRVVVSPYL